MAEISAICIYLLYVRPLHVRIFVPHEHVPYGSARACCIEVLSIRAFKQHI